MRDGSTLCGDEDDVSGLGRMKPTDDSRLELREISVLSVELRGATIPEV